MSYSLLKSSASQTPAQSENAESIHDSSPAAVAQLRREALLAASPAHRMLLQLATTEAELPLQGKVQAAQSEGHEEEELLQGKFATKMNTLHQRRMIGTGPLYVPIQRQVPQDDDEDKPSYTLAQEYAPQGFNLPVGRHVDRPSWQPGYRNACLKNFYGSDDPGTIVTDVTGKSVPMWAIELDHKIPWSNFRDVMIRNGSYSIAEAKLYYHDLENLQPLNAHENRDKSDRMGPDYEIPERDAVFGLLPREALQAVSDLVYDANNTSALLSYFQKKSLNQCFTHVKNLVENWRRSIG